MFTEEFFKLFEAKIQSLAASYNPVALNRLYPFLVSHLPAKMIEQVLRTAIERGLIALDVSDTIPRGPGIPPDKVTHVRLIEHGDAPPHT